MIEVTETKNYEMLVMHFAKIRAYVRQR